MGKCHQGLKHRGRPSRTAKTAHVMVNQTLWKFKQLELFHFLETKVKAGQPERNQWRLFSVVYLIPIVKYSPSCCIVIACNKHLREKKHDNTTPHLVSSTEMLACTDQKPVRYKTIPHVEHWQQCISGQLNNHT